MFSRYLGKRWQQTWKSTEMKRMIGLKRHFLGVGRDHVGFISASETTASSISCCIIPELFSPVTRPCWCGPHDLLFASPSPQGECARFYSRRLAISCLLSLQKLCSPSGLLVAHLTVRPPTSPSSLWSPRGQGLLLNHPHTSEQGHRVQVNVTSLNEQVKLQCLVEGSIHGLCWCSLNRLVH